MSTFDRIIGYDHIKAELMQISDMIHHRRFTRRWTQSCRKGCCCPANPASAKH